MLFGIGTDLCGCDRMARCLQSPAFAARVFSAQEQALLASRTGKARAETAAANFAAKEAFLKAAGTGLGGFALAELSFLREKSGRPVFAPSGRAAAWCAERQMRVQVSLTHEKGLAAAFVVLELPQAPPACPPPAPPAKNCPHSD